MPVVARPPLLKRLYPRVMLAGLFGVVDRMRVMAMRDVRMVAGGFVAPFLMMLRGLQVVLGRVFQMLGGFPVMFCGFFGHDDLLL
jgi:hypothetical protein